MSGPSNPKTTVTPTGDRQIRVERVFDAPRAAVWRAFTEAELIARWWGGERVVVERNEVHRGGHWRFVQHSDDGVQGFEGRYRDVSPPERLERTFEWDGMPGHVSVETLTLEDLGDGRTRVVSTSMFLTREDRDGILAYGMEEGLGRSYAALDQLLATLG